VNENDGDEDEDDDDDNEDNDTTGRQLPSLSSNKHINNNMLCPDN
jgi:hypothetical protein